MDLQAIVDHGHGVVAHLAGSNRVKDGSAEIARSQQQVFVATQIRAWLPL